MYLVCLLLLAGLAVPATAGELLLGDLEDPAAWDGLAPDTAVAREGRHSGLWKDSVAVTTVRLKQCPKDWSGYKGLAFEMHSEAATGKQIDLIAMSDRGKFDYFQYRIALEWTGWKSFRIPFDQFWKVRDPKGWDQIDSFFFSSTWGDTPSKGSVIRFDAVKLTDDVPQSITELMSDEQFYARLDLARPGLEKVGAAVEAKDAARVRTELAAYYRARKLPRHFVDPDARPAPKSNAANPGADRIVQHQFTYYGYPPQQLGPKIDWNASPVGDYEWPTALNRHGDLTALARAWFATGRQEYPRALQEMLLDWIGEAKAASFRVNNVFWSTLNIACRLADAWPAVWYSLRDCDSFTPEARVAMLKSLWHQAEYLMQNHGGGNWLLTESRALVTVGTLFPEFQRAAEWKAEGWRRLTREIGIQTYPEGAQFELTPHYHLVCIGAFRGPVDLARLNEDPVPEEYLKRLEAMYDYEIRVSKPDRCIPMLNDSDHNDVRGLAREAHRLFPREHFLYVASDGKEGKPPEQASVTFPYAGQYVMRTGWDRQALYCLMDAGPYGYGHQHEDKLSLDVHAYGADLVIDPGRFTYAGGPFGNFFRSSQSHNLVLVDGGGQHRQSSDRATWVAKEPVPVTWQSDARFDYARAAYTEGFGPKNDRAVTHARALLFVKPGYWAVCDFLTPTDQKEHAYDWLWHFGPGEAVGEGAVTFQAAGAGLVVATTLPGRAEVVKGSEDPVQGWVSYWYGRKEPAPAARYSLKASGPVSALTLLYPYPGTSAPAVRLEQPTTDGAVAAARVVHPSGSDLLLFVKAGEKRTWQGVETDAEAACIRLDAAGRALSGFRAGGTYLRYQGKTVVP